MLQLLFKNWWVLLLKGILLIVFGIVSFLNPGATITALVYWFAIFVMMDGILSVIGAIMNWKTEEDKWLLLAEGILGLVFGFLVFRSPETFATFVGFLIGFWAMFIGIARIAMAIQLRKEIQGEGWLILSGVLSILFGIIVFTQPGVGVTTVLWMAGIFAILIGVLLAVLSFRLKAAGARIRERAGQIKAGLQNLSNDRAQNP